MFEITPVYYMSLDGLGVHGSYIDGPVMVNIADVVNVEFEDVDAYVSLDDGTLYVTSAECGERLIEEEVKSADWNWG